MWFTAMPPRKVDFRAGGPGLIQRFIKLRVPPVPREGPGPPAARYTNGPHPCSSETLMRIGPVGQVPGEVRTTPEDGCPRCLAFGHLGKHKPSPGRAGLGE